MPCAAANIGRGAMGIRSEAAGCFRVNASIYRTLMQKNDYEYK